MSGSGGRPAGREGQRRTFLSTASALETPAERALDRVVRSGHSASVLRLYLSRLHPSGVRPYHGRVARCLLDDAVQAAGGQVFVCKNKDLILIAGPEPVAAVALLLLRLFRTEPAADNTLVSVWSLPADEAQIRAELATSYGDPGPVEEVATPLGAITAIHTLMAGMPEGELMQRQTAVRIVGGRFFGLFQELSVNFAAIEERIGMTLPAGSDPYLVRYIAGQLDSRMLAWLSKQGLRTSPALNVNVPLAGIATPGFDALRAAARASGTLLGVDIALTEALADLRLFRDTRDRLQADGCTVALDGVDHHAMLVCDPAALKPDMLKLEWSPLIPALPARSQARIRGAIGALGIERVVVCRAETEAALMWGLGEGIGCFQGRHVDLMLAAERIAACAHSSRCKLPQCIERAAATTPAARVGCLDQARLEGGQLWSVARPAPVA